MKKYILFVVSLYLLCGCVGYRRLRNNYHQLPEASEAILQGEHDEFSLYYGKNIEKEEAYYRKKGFVPIGFVRFVGEKFDDDDLFDFIGDKHAALGIFYFEYVGTSHDHFNMQVPTTTTKTGTFYGSYGGAGVNGFYTEIGNETRDVTIPYSTDMYDQTLMLYGKRKPNTK